MSCDLGFFDGEGKMRWGIFLLAVFSAFESARSQALITEFPGATKENTKILGMPLWAFILMWVLIAVVVALVVCVYCFCKSKSRRKKRNEEFERKIIENERMRAQMALTTVKALNRQKQALAAQQQVENAQQRLLSHAECPHGYPVNGVDLNGKFLCSICHPESVLMPGMVPVRPMGMSGVEMTPMAPQQYGASAYDPYGQAPVYNTPDPYGAQQQMGGMGGRIRRAEDVSEVPDTPPPVPPPGFVTVPMVFEEE